MRIVKTAVAFTLIGSITAAALFARENPGRGVVPQKSTVKSVQEDGVAVFFSPNGGCEEAVVNVITRKKPSTCRRTVSPTARLAARWWKRKSAA